MQMHIQRFLALELHAMKRSLKGTDSQLGEHSTGQRILRKTCVRDATFRSDHPRSPFSQGTRCLAYRSNIHHMGIYCRSTIDNNAGIEDPS